MAGKRTATSELNHTNWDSEDVAEDAGMFKKAPEDVLKTRVIKTARRRTGGPIGSPSEGGDGSEKKCIFGGFTGFTKTTTDPNAAFSFLKSSTPNTNGTDKKELPVKQNNSKSDEYYAKMKGLNESVSSWIKKHVDENPFINLKPIFTDYEKYFDKMEADNGNGSAPFSLPQSKPKMDENKGRFLFGASEKATKDLPQFSFGAKTESSEVKTTGFTFGTPTTSAFPSKPFGFGNVSKPTPPAPAQVNKDSTETKDDEDEPPKVEFTPVVEEGNVYSTDCKVFVKKDGNFGDRGVGTLYLKPVPNTEKVQLIVRANTNIGKLLCNFILSASVPVKRMGKKDVMLVCIPTQDSNPPPVPILIRVKSSEKADELLQTLEKHKK